MDRNKPGYMNFADIADRLESGKLNAYDVVYTKDTHEVVFIKEDLSLIRMKCRLDVYPSVVVAEYYLNLNTDTYVGQIVGIEQGEWICLYNVNYADNKFIVRKVGVDEYGQLANKPQINGVTLEGNKTTEQLGINIPTKFSQLYDDIGYVTFDHLIENYYSKSQTYSKSEVDTALADKADTNDIPTDLADLQDDSTHRTVTDENIATWNGKSNVIANPAETTEALNSIEIDGVGYAVAGSGGGAVNSVNGKVGDVVLDASDVGALSDDTPLFSGSYNDLTDKPTLADLSDDSDHRTVTDAEKTQWNAAEANVQADWNQTTTSADDYIKNKPTNLVQDANYVHTDNNFTNANKTKLNDIEAGAEVNVQSDWNQTDSTQDDYIKNKPSIPDPQIQSDWNQTNGTAKDYIKNKPTLGSASALDVATSGDASATQVVKGDDSRLSDARTPVSHTHTLSEITDAGTAASKNSTSSVTADSTDLVESGAVKTAIDNAISGAYKHAGTKTCAELISSLLIASNNGNVYNITDSGTTTADFIEGAGIPIRAGDNVGIAKISDSIYKFDLLSGFIDTSNFVNKSSTSGLIKNDGSIDTTEYAPASSVPAAQIQSDWLQSDNTKLDYIKNKPTLGSAAAKNVPSSGNAGNSEVVLGNDSRLSDARNAADVYSWAKTENKPSYTKSEVGLGNVDNTSDATKKSNFTGSIASGDTGFVTGGDVYSALGDKVDKVEGKGLSTNDYSTTEKNKLAGIAEGAEVNVQSDWNQTTNTADDYIKNKPANLVQDASYVHTDNNYTSDEKTKLSGIAANAEVNQNAFSNVKVGSTTIASGEKTATLELEAGSNITLTPDADNKKVVLSATDTTYSDATTTVHGLMSAADKTKLDGISDNAKKVESSSTNGHIEIDDVDTTVYDDTAIQTAINNIEDELSTDSATIEGNPINFSTKSAQNAESTIIDLEPIQDLHGYSKPWVGGTGKNKLPMTVDSIKSVNTSGTWSGNAYTDNGVTYTLLTDDDNNVVGINANNMASPNQSQFLINFTLPNNTSYKLSGITGGSTTTYLFYCADLYILEVFSGEKEFTADGNSHTLIIAVRAGQTVSNVKFYPMIRLSTVTDATFEPYTNIASISGRSEVDILGCGKNLLDPTYNKVQIQGSFSDAGITYTYLGDGKIQLSNTATARSYGNFTFVTGGGTGQPCINLKNKQLILSCEGLINNVFICWGVFRSDGTYYGNKNYNLSITRESVVFTMPNDAVALRFYTQIEPGTAINTPIVISPMLRYYEIEDPTYSPYQSSTSLQIQLGQTVYGGTLDVENGVLVVEKTISTFDGSVDEDWSDSTSDEVQKQYVITISSMRYSLDAICDKLPCINIADRGSKTAIVKYGDQMLRLSFKLSEFNIADVSEARTWLSNNPIQVCYAIKPYITLQLTPNTINLLKGVNNISTDGDKITLTYRNGKFATLDGAVPKMTFRGEDYTMGVDDIGLFLKNLTKSTKTYIANPLLNFDGTVATYKKIMKQWFINNGVNIMDSTGITYLCERWYEITKQGWKGGTSFPAVGVSTGSTGTRFDDNVGMSVTPSTDTSANTDTYQGLPLFAITDCNWELDSDGNILITAIDGITDNFVRNDPTKFVGVMQQTGWVKKVDDASTQKYYYADDKDAYEDLVPLPEAIKLDGTVRSFVVHAKYMSGIVDSKMTCCSGIIPRRNISHDGLVTLPDNIGTQYSGGTSVDWSFLVWMQRIKYASLTSDGVLQGCCNYNYQYYVKVGETGVKRLILSSANGANLKVGSTVTFGAYAGNADRGQAATYSISGQDGAIITAIEDVTIDSTTYKAIYVNTTSTFDTVANGDAINGTTIVSTYHWVSGSCDNVKGNDGSPVSATNGVYPAKLQGIEYMVGGYEVFADVIMNISGGYYNPYYARKSTDQATSITSSMVQSTLKCAQPLSDAWRYIQKHGFDGEIFYPVSTGTSSSEYTKDGFYENGTGTTTGTREWLAFGYLDLGSGNAGLSFLAGASGLGYGRWNCVARLSCNGNRGILLTA